MRLLFDFNQKDLVNRVEFFKLWPSVWVWQFLSPLGISSSVCKCSALFQKEV